MRENVTIYLDDGRQFKGVLLATYPFLRKTWVKIRVQKAEIIINLHKVTSIHYPLNHPNNERYRKTN